MPKKKRVQLTIGEPVIEPQYALNIGEPQFEPQLTIGEPQIHYPRINDVSQLAGPTQDPEAQRRQARMRMIQLIQQRLNGVRNAGRL